MFEDLIDEKPSFVPSYTGYCPQNKFLIGERYAAVTHKIITDPRYAHIYNNSKTIDNCRTSNGFNQIIHRIDERADQNGDSIYCHPMVSTYKGYLPKDSMTDGNQLGQRFTIATACGLDDFYKNICVGKRHIGEIRKRGPVILESMFRRDDEGPSFYKLNHGGHHPFESNYFGSTNFEVTKNCRTQFEQHRLYEKIKRRSPITTRF